MFSSKQKSLITHKEKTTSASAFITAGMKQNATTKSGNGATKYSETDNPFVTDFGSIGAYKAPREFQHVSATMMVLWAVNALLTVKFTLYLRTITRKVQYWFNGQKTEAVQKGAGLKHESIYRMMWIAINHQDTFWKNINLFISLGSWKDIITMLSYDLQFHGWNDRKLNWDTFGKLILAGLENANSNNLIRKYLPQIKSNSHCKTLESQADNIIAKWISSLLFNAKTDNSTSYRKYRKYKSSGTAHQWQQLISQGKHNLVDFNTIHGRALSLMVSSKYLKNQGLEAKYQEWIANKPVAKFTGYVYELASKINNNLKKYQEDTINAQYKQLLSLAGKNNKNFIVVKDTSGSMNSVAYGTTLSSYTIAKSLSIYFANLIEGFFNNYYIDFSSKAILRQVKGSNFVEHWKTEQRVESANTNFLGVAELFAQLKGGVAEKEFPTGLIIISDGEFDNTRMFQDVNILAFKTILLKAGFSINYVNELTFVFWDIRNTFYGKYQNRKFETYSSKEHKVFYFGGYDGSVISFLTGTEKTENNTTPTNAEELFLTAMDQEVLNLVEL